MSLGSQCHCWCSHLERGDQWRVSHAAGTIWSDWGRVTALTQTIWPVKSRLWGSGDGTNYITCIDRHILATGGKHSNVEVLMDTHSEIAGLTAWIVTVCSGGKHQSSFGTVLVVRQFLWVCAVISEILEIMQRQLMSFSFVVMVTLSKNVSMFWR